MPEFSRGRRALGFTVGVLLLLSALAHAFLGWPAIAAELAGAGAGEGLAGALAIGWHFGSVAMLTFGLIVLRITVRGADPDPLRIVAVAYVLFGLAAWLIRDFNPHFLLFIVTGALLALFAFPRRPH